MSVRVKSLAPISAQITVLQDGQEILHEHIHSRQKTKPTLADSLILTGGATAWALGNKVEIFAADEVLYPFDIHWIDIGSVSAIGDVYEIELYSGLAGFEVEIGQCRAYRQANQSGAAPSPMMTSMMPAGTRITAACANTTGGNETIAISVFYHEYI